MLLCESGMSYNYSIILCKCQSLHIHFVHFCVFRKYVHFHWFLTTVVRNVCRVISILFSSFQLQVLGRKSLVMDKLNS